MPELREKIEKIQCPHSQNFPNDFCGRCFDVAQDYSGCENPEIDQILALIIPKDKPPYPVNMDFWSMDYKEREAWRKGAQAQREVDIKGG